MANHLQILIFQIFFVFSVSSVRMQRDFSYPRVEDFKVYWNVPTFLCRKHGFNFETYTRKFGITTNNEDSFRGNSITILYDPGLFPAMMKSSDGKLVERNGGIPQLGNLTLHLDAFKNAVEQAVPQDFRGVGIIDFEAWRPVFRQNWNDQTIYKKMSKELERQRHPQLRENQIDFLAAYHFEEAARGFMETTLQLAKLLRPRATWGYYAFPYCYNTKNYNQNCPEIVGGENNRIQWMFDESTAIYPSLYMSSELNTEEHRQFVIGRLNEAWRVATRVSSRRVPQVHPYVWFKYFDSPNFMTQEDMFTTLETIRRYKMGGAIIWGSTENVTGKDNCQALLNYLNNVLGPAVARVRENQKRDREPQGLGSRRNTGRRQ